MDRRQQKTRTAIFEAFGKLLSVKSYSKITVQDIIDAANIGRTTFYAHFETKDSLLKEMCVDLFEHIFSNTLIAENTHDFSLSKGEPAIIITHILYHLKDSKKNIAGILSCESGDLFLNFFKKYLEDLIENHLLDRTAQAEEKVSFEFLVNHISSSFVGMVQWWIKNNMKQSPEELANSFMSVIIPVIRQTVP